MKSVTAFSNTGSSNLAPCFTPQPLRAVRVFVFTHGVWMGRKGFRRAVDQREKACPGYCSEIIRCKMLILGRDFG